MKKDLNLGKNTRYNLLKKDFEYFSFLESAENHACVVGKSFRF